MKKWLKCLGKLIMTFMGLVIICVVGYISYMFITYERIDDNTDIEVTNTEKTCENMAKIGETYEIITYNIGFGAYSDDYSFFMDGGEYSRALSSNAVVKNITGALETVKKGGESEPDIVFMQEIDLDSTRSYHINEYDLVLEHFRDYASSFAVNYHSKYLMYPLTQPHGASNAGMATLTKLKQLSSLRRQLPISSGFGKFFDLDRAYMITRIPVENGKELVLYNLHLSAYTNDITIVKKQIEKISDDMSKELEKGNYIICGGDFNQDMLQNSSEIFGTEEYDVSWAKPFPKELLPDGMENAYTLKAADKKIPSCRNADVPYIKGESFVITIDGFIISDNIEMVDISTIDTGFKYSDHNPVSMTFKLLS